MEIRREWAMPNHNTFSIKPIREWIGEPGGIAIDPFARGSKIASITNDLNPDFDTDYNMDALDFLRRCDDESVDCVLFDPPYCLRQLKECYDGLGVAMTHRESQRFFSDLKDEVSRTVKSGGTVLSFGWSTVGMGKSRVFEIVDILLVCHGGIHNDTICVRERKL